MPDLDKFVIIWGQRPPFVLYVGVIDCSMGAWVTHSRCFSAFPLHCAFVRLHITYMGSDNQYAIFLPLLKTKTDVRCDYIWLYICSKLYCYVFLCSSTTPPVIYLLIIIVPVHIDIRNCAGSMWGT